MSIKKLGEDDFIKFRQCKTEDDYRGFVRDLGLDLSAKDIAYACGGLALLETAEAFNTLAERIGSSESDRVYLGGERSTRGIK